MSSKKGKKSPKKASLTPKKVVESNVLEFFPDSIKSQIRRVRYVPPVISSNVSIKSGGSINHLKITSKKLSQVSFQSQSTDVIIPPLIFEGTTLPTVEAFLITLKERPYFDYNYFQIWLYDIIEDWVLTNNSNQIFSDDNTPVFILWISRLIDFVKTDGCDTYAELLEMIYSLYDQDLEDFECFGWQCLIQRTENPEKCRIYVEEEEGEEYEELPEIHPFLKKSFDMGFNFLLSLTKDIIGTNLKYFLFKEAVRKEHLKLHKDLPYRMNTPKKYFGDKSESGKKKGKSKSKSPKSRISIQTPNESELGLSDLDIKRTQILPTANALNVHMNFWICIFGEDMLKSPEERDMVPYDCRPDDDENTDSSAKSSPRRSRKSLGSRRSIRSRSTIKTSKSVKGKKK